MPWALRRRGFLQAPDATVHCTSSTLRIAPGPPRRLARQRAPMYVALWRSIWRLIVRVRCERGGCHPPGLKSVPKKCCGALTFHARQISEFSFTNQNQNGCTGAGVVSGHDGSSVRLPGYPEPRARDGARLRGDAGRRQETLTGSSRNCSPGSDGSRRFASLGASKFQRRWLTSEQRQRCPATRLLRLPPRDASCLHS